MRKTKAVVVLSNGEHFVGEAFGASGRAIGEVVFNTSMSGYQEILTDPSYRGQLVTMTAPHIGNYGVNPVDVESDRVQVAGFIVREASRVCSNFRATATLQDYLAEQGVVGITGVDTRALTRRIRDAGAVMGAVVHDAGPADVPGIVEEILAAPEYGTVDYVGEVSVDAPRRASLVATNDPFVPRQVALSDDDGPWPAEDTDKPWVAVLDFGVKHSILRHLLEQGMRVTLFPHDTDPDRLLALRPAGVLLSNGPGDPGQMDADVGRVSAIVGRVPIFGICLGHQLLSRALGARTFKLKFGHRGQSSGPGERE